MKKVREGEKVGLLLAVQTAVQSGAGFQANLIDVSAELSRMNCARLPKYVMKCYLFSLQPDL